MAKKKLTLTQEIFGTEIDVPMPDVQPTKGPKPKKAKADKDTPMPWCDACQSYHVADNETCRALGAQLAEMLPPINVVTPAKDDLMFDVPMDVYQAWDLASSHRLGKLDPPARCKWEFEHQGEREESDVFRKGTALHAATLEAKRFSQQYVVVDGHRGRNDVKATLRKVAADGMFALKPEEMGDVVAMRRALLDHDTAAALLMGASVSEVSITWTQPLPNGKSVRCRCRPDFLTQAFRGGETLSVAVNVKTDTNAAPDPFAFKAGDLGYFREAAMTMAGLATHGYGFDLYAFLVVEKKPPYFVATYFVDPMGMDLGTRDFFTRLNLFRVCQETGVWPAYSAAIEPLRPMPKAQMSHEREHARLDALARLIEQGGF